MTTTERKLHVSSAISPRKERNVAALLISVRPEDAQRWLTSSVWNKQRRYREWHGEELAQAMRNDEFTQGTQIHFVKLKGVVYLVNGQHTLHAIVKFGGPVNLSVLTTEVEAEHEIAEIYSREDQHLRRSLSDSYEAHDLCATYGLSKAQVNQVGAGVRVIIGGFVNNPGSMEYKSRSSDARLRSFNKYGDAAKAFFKSTKGAPAQALREVRSSAVMAVALETFLASPSKAGEFWSQVVFTDGLGVGDPRKTLLDWLRDNPNRRCSAAARSRVVAHAWSLFLDGGSSKRFKMPDWTKPIVIRIAAESR